MEKKICFVFLIIFLFVSFSCKKTENPDNKIDSLENEVLNDDRKENNELLLQKIKNDEELSFWSDYPDELLAEEIVSRMTDEELLAQLFMFGWAGAEPSKLVTYWVNDRHIGSIKIFGWNTDDVELVAKNITLLQKKSMEGRFKIPLYVATDQEGGWIRHVKGVTSDTPGNLAIGASGYPMDAYFSGLYIARELRAIGINMNFAPSVDLYTDHDSSVIGPRSFGEYPTEVAVLGTAFASGTLSAGVIPTAKHYPGHGDTGLDSHGKLPIIDINADTLFNRELVPFKYLIDSGIPAIMSGHLAFPQITKNDEPASLSETFLQQILRDELGFDGLIISDDMMMNGATVYAGGLSAAFRMAIQAGNNILCSSTTPQINSAVWTENIEYMTESPKFRNTVKESAQRVILTKLQYFKSENAVPIIPKIEDIEKSVPDPEGKKFFLEQACRSITLYKKGTFPLPSDKAGKVLLAAPYQEFFDEGIKRYPGSGLFFYKSSPDDEELERYIYEIKRKVSGYDTVILFVSNAVGQRLLQELSSLNVRVVAVSGLSPVYVMEKIDWVDSVLMCYSYSPYSFKAVFAALSGDFNPQGVLPLTSGAQYDLLQ